ncbi:MAG: hypothetical protein [Virus sp.]|nr:MAG: hypothetical protein [Virus sp.]
MYYCYGLIRSVLTSCPANTALYRGITCFTAGENPVEIRMGAFWGGDLNEFYTLALAPPAWVSGTSTVEGTNPESDANGIIPITGGIKGGLFTNAKKGNIFIPVTIDDSIISPVIVPPFYNLVVYPTTGTMNTSLQLTILGMDLMKP